MNSVQPILDRVLAGERMSVEECTTPLESHDIARMWALAADEVRARRHLDNVVTYIIDRNINYTNVCNVVCTFCSIAVRARPTPTSARSTKSIRRSTRRSPSAAPACWRRAGLHPDFGIEWYEDLLRTLSAKHGFQLHCFSPPEIHNLHLISKLDYETIMARLKAAGLYSLPGGGAEILDDVRKRVSTKCTTDEWLDVMRAVHRAIAFDRHDDVRHRRSHRASRQALATHPRSTGRNGVFHRVHSDGPSSVRTRRWAAGLKTSRRVLII